MYALKQLNSLTNKSLTTHSLVFPQTPRPNTEQIEHQLNPCVLQSPDFTTAPG